MSDRGKNVVFILLALLCLTSVFVHNQVAHHTSIQLAERARALSTIVRSQGYAGKTSEVALYELKRAAQIQKDFNRLAEKYVNLSAAYDEFTANATLQSMSLQITTTYLNQLIEYIREHDLPVPDLDTSKLPAPAYTADPLDAAPTP